MTDEKLGLTVYLLKPGEVKEFEQVLMQPTNGVLPLAAPLDGNFRAFPADQKEPSWVAAVRALLPGAQLNEMLSGMPGGLLHLRRPGGNFVITFGFAWTRLKDKWIEPTFGKRVALNSIATSDILEIRAEQVFAKFHISNERAPRGAQVEEFALDPSRDVVASIEGMSSEVAAGAPIRGATSLRLNVRMADLADELDRAAKLYKSDAYIKKWPEIDNIVPVDDLSIITDLDARLDNALATCGVDDSIPLFSPAFKRADSLNEQWYSYGRRSASPVLYTTLKFSDWFNMLKGKSLKPSVNQAKAWAVHLFDDNKEPQQKTTVYDCLTSEVSLNDKPYILSSGQWYEVIPRFLGRTRLAIDNLRALNHTLPKWKSPLGGEPAYNKECEKLPGMLYFDAKPVMYGGGQGKFEFCDLIHPEEKALFFVKNCTRSSGTSHLVEQVRRTAELLFSTDPGFRNALYPIYEAKTSAARAKWLKSRPRNGEWKLCLVSLGRRKEDLPFFAKCSLVNLHKHLSERGHLMFFKSV